MIVVTGAAGFIGSNLAHRLAALGHHLWLVDHPFSAVKTANWVGLSRFCFTTEEIFLQALRSRDLPIEAVFHLGACSRTTETDWGYLLRNNVEFSQMLWTWCSEAGKPFYYASSAATYGDGSNGFDDRLPPSELRPLNLYGKSKNTFDLWVWRWVAEGLPTPPGWAGLKFFNVYGPREDHKGSMASVVWQTCRQILATGEMHLFKSNDPRYPDGGQRRDFVFVEDCIDHLLWLWENPGVCGLFNSGTGVARTFEDLARAVFGALGREPRIGYIDMPAELCKQYQNFTRADMTKLQAAGFSRPATTLEAGVASAITITTSVDPTENPK
ncbi:ADP-glyceromanno-heptose 6-epimerase [Singulisphaera acidiphila]|uniref:ADP-L-glycero-D-manno-heptose-6-epimerase n=1 Tax=Singulisphaera acidiphila (strain ATCC BAA-1392 / DSM 18658 / VKM B-2454 / MOB10) TaxID=886293 RepID=L0DJS1_SINAD|nr:ADP-glyceromanno-heptose 6-epimerase [Singulisphaera acidiphila]AGA29083.1 ADP-L-glycero-D-manno-heptose-6-epimerase [Singulisphaera acidiphila DSM 18658]